MVDCRHLSLSGMGGARQVGKRLRDDELSLRKRPQSEQPCFSGRRPDLVMPNAHRCLPAAGRPAVERGALSARMRRLSAPPSSRQYAYLDEATAPSIFCEMVPVYVGVRTGF